MCQKPSLNAADELPLMRTAMHNKLVGAVLLELDEAGVVAE